MIAGYLRVSTGKQNLENQKDEILRYAERRKISIDCWVTEVASGKKNEKERKLGALFKKMKPGDTIIVTEISRLSRTLTEIMEIMGKCLKKNIRLYTTKEGYSFDDSINSKVLCFAFGLVAEIERNLISMRTKEALALRKANGVVLGRKKGSYTKMNILQENKGVIEEMILSGMPTAVICRRFNLSRETFYKFKKLNPSIEYALAQRKIRKTPLESTL